MKKLLILSTVILFFAGAVVHAQSTAVELPPSTLVPHYRLSVSVNTTTVLIFPAAVKPVDRGDRDLLAQKQAEVDNVLKLKAARPNISATNLHVFTADGHVYCFDITYTDSAATTRNLSGLTSSVAGAPQVLLTQEPVNTETMEALVAQTHSLPSNRVARAHSNRMTLRLDAIGLSQGLLFFRLKLLNHSDLDYHVDFVRLYIRDHEQVKRSSVQEMDLAPVYEDTTARIAGQHGISHIVAVPAFSLPAHKHFYIEVFEKNGGRSLTLQLKNKDLFRLKKLSSN